MFRKTGIAIVATMLLSSVAATAAEFDHMRSNAGPDIGSGIRSAPPGAQPAIGATNAPAGLEESHMRAEGGPNIGPGVSSRPAAAPNRASRGRACAWPTPSRCDAGRAAASGGTD